MSSFRKAAPKPAVEAEKSVVEFKTRLAKNVFNILFNQEQPQKNQLFKPGRMAFLWDLDDELGNWETPTTLIRSKAELRSEEVFLFFFFHTARVKVKMPVQ
jgi:hypothetical protein